MNLKAIERDKWLASEEGQRCAANKASGIYLKNRLEVAWCAGWDAANVNNHLVLGALDTLGTALSEHEHVWSDGEKELYEQAVKIVKAE